MDFSMIVVLMIVSSVVGVYVANRCGQTELEGFCHGFLFGPIGWILIALYPYRPQSRPQTREHHDE